MNHNPETVHRTSTELRSEQVIDYAGQQGIHVEVGNYIDPKTGETTYFAMSLPHFMHEIALEHVLSQYIRRHQTTHQALATPSLYPIMPLTKLPQADFEAQITYVSEHPEPMAAIMASRAVLLEQLGYTYELPPEEPAS